MAGNRSTFPIRHDADLVDRFRAVLRARQVREERDMTLKELTDPILAAALPKLEKQEGIEERK